jgi:hypothetical protein
MQFSELQKLIEKSKLPLLQFLQKRYPQGSSDWIDYTCLEIYLKYMRLNSEGLKLNNDIILEIAQEEISLQEKDSIL